jgi:hypothetical protein
MKRFALIAAGWAVCAPPPSPAVASPASVRQAVVMITASGTNVNAGNAPMSVQGTGFFISKNGYLATAYHLFTKLTDAGVDPRTITYSIQYASDPASPTQASQFYSIPAADIMILYTQTDGHAIQTLTKAERTTPGFDLGSTVFTAGYPQGYGFTVDTGILKNFGPTAPIPAWTVSINFKEGQSGSPILLADDRVIAVASSADVDAVSFDLVFPSQLIPPQFWDDAAPSAPPATSQRRVVVDALTAAIRPQPRTKLLDFVNNHCVASKVYAVPVKATDGWTIDPHSITIDRTASVGPDDVVQVQDVGSSGFTVKASLSNIGTCLSVAGHQVPLDVGAEYHGLVRYTEKPRSGTQQWQTITDAQAVGGVTAPIQKIPADKLRVTVFTPQGSVNAPTLSEKDVTRLGSARVLDIAKIAASATNM